MDDLLDLGVFSIHTYIHTYKHFHVGLGGPPSFWRESLVKEKSLDVVSCETFRGRRIG